MFLFIWNFFRGYVLIEVKGFSVERFINLITYHGIYVWDLKQQGPHMYMKVSVKGYKMLRQYARKTRCHIKIKGRYGYPFFVYKYKTRHLFIAGMAVFVLMLYSMSSFIWLIDIQGNERLEDYALLEYLETQGLKIGSLKSKLDKKAITENLKNNFNEISWVSINISGTKATIKLAETLPSLEIIDNSSPCDIIADKEGLIVDIVTRSGTPKVKAKDVVSVGDVLVAGELIIVEDENGVLKNYVHSDADIKAKIIDKYNFSIPLTYNTKEFTQNSKTYFDVSIFNKNFNTNFIKNNISFEKYDKIESRTQLKISEDFPLPIIITKTMYNEYILNPKKRSIDVAKAVAEKTINKKILVNYSVDSDIIDKTINYTNTDTDLNVSVEIISIKNIGIEKAISITEGSNAINGAGENTNTE